MSHNSTVTRRGLILEDKQGWLASYLDGRRVLDITIIYNLKYYTFNTI
jgi:hypothetical protein